MSSGSNHNKAYPFFSPTVNSSSDGWTNPSLKGQHGVLNSRQPPPAHALERKHSLNYENFGSFQRHLLNGYANHSTLGAAISTQINDNVKSSNPRLAEQCDLNESGIRSSFANNTQQAAFGNDESTSSRNAENPPSPTMSYNHHHHQHYRNECLRKKSFDVNALRAIYERNQQQQQQQYGSTDPYDGLYHINQQPHHLQSNFYRSANSNSQVHQHHPISSVDMNNNHSLGFRANFDDVTSASMMAAQRASMLARNNPGSHSFSSPRPVDTTTASNDSEKSGSTASLHKSTSSTSSQSSSFSISSDNLNLSSNPSTSSLASSFNNRYGNYLMENPHLQAKQRPHQHAPQHNAFAHHLFSGQMNTNKPAQISDVNELNRLRNFKIGELSSALVDQHLKNLVSNSNNNGGGQNADNEKMFMKDSMLKPGGGFGNFQPAINKRPKSTFPFGKCKVCSDKATGVHYGIATCEGCKGFFKRSTLRKEKYRCFFGNNCPLTPDNRNRCKSCRFRKCLEVGMSIQGVKMGRIPKAEKEKALMILKFRSGTADEMDGTEAGKADMNDQYNYDEISETSSNNDVNNMNEFAEDDYDDDKKSTYNIDEYDSDEIEMGNNGPSEVPSADSTKEDNQVTFSVSDLPDQKVVKASPRSDKYHMKKQIIFNFTNELNEKGKQKSLDDEEVKQKVYLEENPDNASSKPMTSNERSSSNSSLTSSSSSGSSSPVSDESASYDSLDKLAPNNFEANSVNEYIDLVAKSSKIEIKESSAINLASILARKKYQERQNAENQYQEDNMDYDIRIKKTRTEINRVKQSAESTEKNQIAPDNPSQSPQSCDSNPPSKQRAEASSEDDQSDKQVCLAFKSSQTKDREFTSGSYELNMGSFEDGVGLKRKAFRINDLLKFHSPFSTTSLLPTRSISSMYLPNMDDTYLLISSLLSDKIYQLHIEHNHRVTVLYQKALRLIHDGVKDLNGSEKTLEEVWDSLLISIPLQVKAFIGFSKEVPGLNELNPQDFTTLINNRLFDFFLIKHAPLFINEQSYLVLPNNIHYTRELMVQVIGREMVDAIFEFSKEFNSLYLTQKEIALTFPYVLTLHDEIYIDQPTMRNLNEYYMRALFYEFDLNKRDSKFVNKWNQVIQMFPYLSELQAVKIGGLTPPKRAGGRHSI